MHQTAFKVILLGLSCTSSGAIAQSDLSSYVQVDHILLESQESAQLALKLLQAGVPFERLARVWSADPGTSKIGGQLAVTKCSEYVPEFAKFVCSAELLTPGIVKTVFGWHLAVVHGRSQDRRSVRDPDPSIKSPPFTATVTLSCGFPSVPDQSIAVRVDEPNAVGYVGAHPALLKTSEITFRLMRADGQEVEIDRTTGAGVISPRGAEPVAGLVCRAASQRLF